jgi:prevent-host-death family protein
MERIGIRELRQHASRYVALVKAGETVEVTERGRLVAVLAPPDAGRAQRDRLVAAGRLLPATSPSGRLRDAHPVTSEAGDPTNEDLLEREDRL